MAKTKQTKNLGSRKKRATINDTEKQLYGEIRADLRAKEFPFSGVQIKLTLVLPCETYVLYRLSGKSYDKIAEIVGLSKYSVFKLACAYQEMDPPFGGFEPLQINYLRKQLLAGRTLKDIADELNGALDNIQGVAFEDREPAGGSNPEPEWEESKTGEDTPAAEETSPGSWWESGTAGEVKDAGVPEEDPGRGRVFSVPVQSFDSPIAKETVTLRITEQGLKYYISDFKINVIPEKSLTDIINFRLGRKIGPQKDADIDYSLWSSIAEYYKETMITLRNYVHQQVFPPELVAMYRLSGYSYKDIVETVPAEFRKLLGLSENRLASVQKISYRNNPKFQVIKPTDLLQMLPKGTSAKNIDDEAIKRITSKYKRLLTASTTQLDRKTARAKIFKATLTPEGISNYIKDITDSGSPGENKRKPGRPRKEKPETAAQEVPKTSVKKSGSTKKEKAEAAEQGTPKHSKKTQAARKKTSAEPAKPERTETTEKKSVSPKKEKVKAAEQAASRPAAKKRGRPKNKHTETVVTGDAPSRRRPRKKKEETAE